MVEESYDNIGVFREQMNSTGGQVSIVESNVSVAPSLGHNCVLPAYIQNQL